MTSLLTNGSATWDQEVTLRVRYLIPSPGLSRWERNPFPNLRVPQRNCTLVDQSYIFPSASSIASAPLAKVSNEVA